MCIAFLRASFDKIRHRKLAGILSVHHDMACVSEHVASTATILHSLLYYILLPNVLIKKTKTNYVHKTDKPPDFKSLQSVRRGFGCLAARNLPGFLCQFL